MSDAAPASGALAWGQARLPPGRHGLPRTFVAENQRERLLNGVVEAVAERGYNQTTIARITAAAKISRRTFYEYFTDKEECFLAAYELIDAYVHDSLLAVPETPEAWPEQVRARLEALLDLLARDPAVARFYLIEPLTAGGEIAARYRAAMQSVAEILKPEQPGEELPRMDVEVRDQVLMGGIATLIVRRLNAGQAERLRELLPDLTELVLAPYLGRDEARRRARSSSPTS